MFFCIMLTTPCLRVDPAQKNLVIYAAEQEGVSQQQIWSEMYKILEERYGKEIPLDPSL